MEDKEEAEMQKWGKKGQEVGLDERGTNTRRAKLMHKECVW